MGFNLNTTKYCFKCIDFQRDHINYVMFVDAINFKVLWFCAGMHSRHHH